MRIAITLFILLVFNTFYSAAAENKNWKCINEKGETVFSIDAIRVFEFHNGLARVYKRIEEAGVVSEYYGYIDQQGKVSIPFKYEKANDFFGEVAWVKKEEEDFFTLINQNGDVVPTKKYKNVGNFYEWQKDMSAVYVDDKMGFIDSKGKEIIPCKYKGSTFFDDGLACVQKADGEKWGYINKKGEVVIPFELEQKGISKFQNGYAVAEVDGEKVIIDKNGEVVFKTDKGVIHEVNDDLILVSTQKNRDGWGWLNFEDEFVIDPVYSSASGFNESGYALVKKDGLYGLINKSGEVKLDFNYQSIYSNVQKDGFISAVYPSEKIKPMLEAKIDYFDKNFKYFELDEGIKYVYPAEGQDMMMFLSEDKTIGYLNRDFEIVIPAKYEQAKPFSEGLAWVVGG